MQLYGHLTKHVTVWYNQVNRLRCLVNYIVSPYKVGALNDQQLQKNRLIG